MKPIKNKYSYKKKKNPQITTIQRTDKIGIQEIKNAILNSAFNKNEYRDSEIDEVIYTYYHIKNFAEYLDLTMKSGDFKYFQDTYDIIASAMEQKGFQCNNSKTIYKQK